MAVVQAERPGLSRFVLPIAGLIALGLCVGGHPRPARPAGRAEPPRLHLRRARQHVGRGPSCGTARAINWSPRSPGGDRPGRRRRRHLAAVPRRRRAGQPAASRSGATGSCRGSSSAPPWRCWRSSWSIPRRERSCAASRTTTGSFTLANFAVLLEPEFTAILRNNVIWLVVGTGGSVVLGLIIAGLFDRVRRESLAKTFVFLPLAISLVGASVIWRFVYAWQPAGPAADRTVERDRGRPRRRADPVADDQPDQHLLRDRDPGLAPDRLRHGRPLGGDQGRVGRGPRGGPARRRQRAPALLPGDRADDPRLDHHGRDDHRHRHPQDLRHRVRDDRRTVR